MSAGLFALVAWSFIQIFFPPGGIGETIYALLGAVVFSGFIVFDTANLIQNYELDQVRLISISIPTGHQVCLPTRFRLPSREDAGEAEALSCSHFSCSTFGQASAFTLSETPLLFICSEQEHPRAYCSKVMVL